MNAPSASEVAAIMVGDGYDLHASNRDIILRKRDGALQRISETHSSYDPFIMCCCFRKVMIVGMWIYLL